MTYKPDELRELIPLYLNGTLPQDERQKFEEALNKYPELRRELMEFSEIKDLYKEIKKEVPPPSELLYKRILSSIRSEAEAVSASQKKGHIEQFQNFLKGFFSSPRVSWGIVAVQLVIILLLVITTSKEDRFRTLTSEHISRGEGIRINVVFDKESREKEIREILNSIGASIISGPLPEGLYIIELKDERDTEAVLKTLRSSRIVRFAEKAY